MQSRAISVLGFLALTGSLAFAGARERGAPDVLEIEIKTFTFADVQKICQTSQALSVRFDFPRARQNAHREAAGR